MSIVIVGSLALDTIKTPFAKKEMILGGAATYASMSAAFFAKPCVVGVIGEDFPEDKIKLLESKGIDLAGVKKEKGKTFHWEGEYHYDMNSRSTLATDLNVFGDFNPEMPVAYRKMPYLFLANIQPDLQLKVLYSMTNRKFTLCDTMNYWIEHTKDTLIEVFKRVDAVVLNDSEVREFTGATNLITAAKKIKELGPKYVIIKRGEHGASIMGDGKYFVLGTYPVENVVDPTGAGDSFAGAFIGYVAKAGNTNWATLKKALAYANVVASYSVEDFSVDRLAKLSKKEIEGRIKEIKQMINF